MIHPHNLIARAAARVARSSDHRWRVAMRVTMLPVWSQDTRIKMLRGLGVAVPYSASVPDGVFIGSDKVRFGERSGCSVDCFLDGSAAITIGEGVRLGARVAIITGTHPVEANVMRRDLSKPTVAMPVTIGRGCWLGTGVTVLPGVTIGEGCVIGAGAVVTRDCAPNGLYAGSPARRVSDYPVGRVALRVVGS